MSEPERLCSYRTLQHAAAQCATFWRTPRAIPAVTAHGGRTHHPIVVFTSDVAEWVDGIALTGTDAELRHADAYDVDDHRGICVTLDSGTLSRWYAPSRQA
jgi:hypothetical protein